MIINAMLIYFIGEIVTATDHNINKTVEELQNEKKYLLKQINEAIYESVKSLQKANDSDSLVGLKYMEDLKEYMKRVNQTATYMNNTDANEPFASNVENRRKLDHLFDPEKWQGKKTTPKDIFDYGAIVKPKNPSASEWRDIIETRQNMQKKIDEWILERQKEKVRLDKERLKKNNFKMSGVYEKCPRFGFQGIKKKGSIDKIKVQRCKKCKNNNKNKDNTTDERSEKRKQSKSKKKKYPCCRKCCKKSYLGCL